MPGRNFAHRALLVPLVFSVALHLMALFSFGPRAPTFATQSLPPLAARLVGFATPQAVTERPLPFASGPRLRTVRAPLPARKASPAAAPSPVSVPVPSAPIAIPHDSDAPEPAPDARIRTAIIATPATYGLDEKHATPAADLPYAWSSVIDTPPQTSSTREAAYPDGALSSGLVLVRALLGTLGTIDEFSVLCGDEPFAAATTQALAGWSFKAATSEGKPARTWVLLEFAFLADNRAATFDPGRADQSLAAMREKCVLELPAPL